MLGSKVLLLPNMLMVLIDVADKANDIDQIRSRVDIWETCIPSKVVCCHASTESLRMSFAQPDVNHDETIFWSTRRRERLV